jgi:adenosylcobyric acid synthase
LGKIWGQVTASDYHTRRVEQLFPEVIGAYRRLAGKYELVLLEGAGSPAEINLREHDIVNMRMAHAADAACVLVGDIDRGGVFASLLGTLELLEPADRARIRGFIINKFRGDESLLRPGVAMIETRLGVPCLGVVPFLHDLGLDEEDGVALEDRASAARRWRNLESGSERALRIGVIALPHMANFTLILPGTKQTLDDLSWLEQRGFDRELRRLAGIGIPIAGICGGFQMLGVTVEDPWGIENHGDACSRTALGLLSVRTVLRAEKIVRRVRGSLRRSLFSNASAPPVHFEGYEIHVGETFYESGTHPLADIQCQGETKFVADGAVNETGRVFGSYVHGFFDNDDFRHAFIRTSRVVADLAPAEKFARVGAEREARIDRLANHLRKSLDINRLRNWLVKPCTRQPMNPAG